MDAETGCRVRIEKIIKREKVVRVFRADPIVVEQALGSIICVECRLQWTSGISVDAVSLDSIEPDWTKKIQGGFLRRIEACVPVCQQIKGIVKSDTCVGET